MPPPSSPRPGPCSHSASEKNSCISSSGTATAAAASLALASAIFTLAPGVKWRRFKGLRRESNTATARTPLAVHAELSGFTVKGFFDEPHALHARKKVNPLPNSAMCAWIRVLPQRGCCDLNVFAAAPLRHHRQLHGSVFARPRQLLLPSNDDSAFSIQRGAVSVVCNHRLLSVFQVWLIGVYRI